MTKPNDEIETVIFQALSHPMRRRIITILDGTSKGLLYTELITELGLPTGKMNYHIQQLEGLIEKNLDQRYVLTSLGKKALSQLKQLKHDVTDEDTKYLAIAERNQRSSLEPTVRSLLILSIAASLIVIAVSSIVAYVMITEGGAPLPIMLLLPFLLAFEIALAVTLIRALRNAPAWLRKLERRFIEVS